MGKCCGRFTRFLVGPTLALGVMLAPRVSFSEDLANAVKTTKILTIKLSEYRVGLQQLVAEGYDIAGVDLKRGTADVVVAGSDVDSLRSLKLGRVIAEKDIDPEKGPDARYTTYAELTSILQDFAQKFPGILKIESIGKSHESRDIWAVKMSDNVNSKEDEPAIFFNAMHHAREVMTTEVALDIIQQLTSGYSSDERVRRWIDGSEIWIVPMVNPDGNNKVWSSNSMWRKNTREGYGVDINRNYPFAWGSCGGSSGSTYSDTYRGPSAGSEPETQAIMGLVAKIQPVISVSYHSYSEIVIYPYGCDGERASDRETVEGLGKELASKLVTDSGNNTYEPGTSWELLYAVDGGDIDWYHNVHQVLPYVIELNSGSQGFQPSYNWRQPTVERMRPGWALMLDRLGQSGIRGSVIVDGRRASTGSLTVSRLTAGAVDADATQAYKLKTDGSFHVVVEPGMYKVTFEDEDLSVSQDVLVGAERQDISFQISGLSADPVSGAANRSF